MWTDLLQWALPSGFIGVLITWLANRQQNKIKSEQTISGAYKQMYDDLADTLKKQSDENRKLFEAVALLRRAIGYVGNCRYQSNCPVSAELRKSKKIQPGYANNHERQRVRFYDDNDENFDGTVITGKPPP